MNTSRPSCNGLPEIGRGTHDLEALSTIHWPKALDVHCSFTRREVSKRGNIVFIRYPHQRRSISVITLDMAQVYSIRTIYMP